MLDSFKIYQAATIPDYANVKRRKQTFCYFDESKRSPYTEISISQTSPNLEREPSAVSVLDNGFMICISGGFYQVMKTNHLVIHHYHLLMT